MITATRYKLHNLLNIRFTTTLLYKDVVFLATWSSNIFKVPRHANVAIGHDGIKLSDFQPTRRQISGQHRHFMQLQQSTTAWLHLYVSHTDISSQRLQTKFAITSLDDADVRFLSSTNKTHKQQTLQSAEGW